MQPTKSNRWGAGIGVFAVHALVACALLYGLAGRPVARDASGIETFDVALPPPPPPPTVREAPAARKSAASAPKNLKAKAAEVVAPPTIVPAIVPPPIPVAPVRGVGAQSHAGASDAPGPGTGAGGRGNGFGSGDDGDGDGDGGIPPRLVHGRIRDADYPRALRQAGIGGTVGVRYRVDVDGRASDCRVTHGSGSTELDVLTCRLIEERFRFDPSRDEYDRKVPSALIENHTWVAEPRRDPDGD